MAGLVVLKTYLDPTEAIVARSVLEQHGLLVTIPELNHYSVLPMYLFALDGIHLMVHADDVEDASALLEFADDQGYEKCPECDGHRYVRFASYKVLLFLPFTVISPIQFLNWRRCGDCGHKWRAREVGTFHLLGFAAILLSFLLILMTDFATL